MMGLSGAMMFFNITIHLPSLWGGPLIGNCPDILECTDVWNLSGLYCTEHNKVVFKYRDPSPTPTLDTEGDFGERTHRGHHSVHFTYYTVTVYSVQYALSTVYTAQYTLHTN